MRGILTVSTCIAAVLALAARNPERSTGAEPVMTGVAGVQAGTMSSDCVPYTPSDTVHIAVNAEQTFGPASTGCSGLSISISPANGTAGFTSGTACTLTSFTTGSAGIFKIRGCQPGTVTVSIKQGSTTLQTITLIVDYV